MSARFFLIPIMAAMLAMVSTGCGHRVDPGLFAQFQRIQEAFDQAQRPDEFMRVAAQYQEMLDGGLVSGAVFYNQGNAFMRAGKRGRAIACYRQAARYRPRDPYLEANLAYALGEVAAEPPRKPLLEYILFWQNWLSYPEKILIDTAAGGLTFLLAVAGMFWRPKQMNRAAVAMLLLTVIGGVSVGYDWHRFDQIQRGVVIRAGAIARKGDGASYAPAFTQPLAEGTEFRVLEKRSDWILVELPGAQQGWLEVNQAVVY